jgi:hypothetical protein
MKKLIGLIIVMFFLLGVTKTQAQVEVQVAIAPPALPVYVQPDCPYDGYIWTPGYWAYDDGGYYWVPGVWVAPPEVGFLWTPFWWGFENGVYIWHRGYWGPHVGFYGGINYGYGYGGHGYYGGRWEGGHFRYNTAVSHVDGGRIHNTYEDRSVAGGGGGRASFNGKGGVEAQPTAEERTAMNEKHVQPTSMQQSHEHSSSISKNQHVSVNHGSPKVVAKNSVGGQRYDGSGHSVAKSSPAQSHSAQPQHQAAPQRQAQPQHQAAPQHQAQPQRQAAPQHQMQPQHQAAPQGGRGGGGNHGGGRR